MALIPIHLADDRPIWERQPEETDRAYERFAKWLYWPGLRPIFAEIAAISKVSTSAVTQGVVKYRWQERARAYDAEQTRLWELEKDRARRASAERAARIASLFDDKVEGGVNNLDEDNLTPADLARLSEAASKYKKESFGEAPVQTIITTPQEDPTTNPNLTDTERIAMYETAIAELRKRAGK